MKPPGPIKKPVGRPKLNLTPDEELARKKKRYTPKEVKQRRGRKMTKYDEYVSAGDKKIEELKQNLLTAKDDGVSVEVRKKWRCKVSAHQNRMKKRKEIEVLNFIVKKKDERAI